jgi:hypothetical protein
MVVLVLAGGDKIIIGAVTSSIVAGMERPGYALSWWFRPLPHDCKKPRKSWLFRFSWLLVDRKVF